MHPLFYRPFQFFAALKPLILGLKINDSANELILVKAILPLPPQISLFNDMSPNDQRHAIAVARTLQQTEYNNVALLQAALLHDVAKSLGQPIIHRVLIVLLESFTPAILTWLSFPASLKKTGSNLESTIRQISWWQRPFVIHAHHPSIGAAWAQAVACEPLAIRLIACHQEKLTAIFSEEDKLLVALQWADNLN